VNQNLPGLAFAAGLVAALNPCGFALLPAYLALVVRGESGGRWGAVGRALAATAAMTLGFLAVFGTFGLLTVTVAARVQRYLPYATVVIGIVLIALGVWLLAGRRLAVASFGGRWAPTARIGSMLGYGVGYACASLGCTIGPFLAVTGAALRGGRYGVTAYLAYAAGFGLLVGVLAIAVALARSALIDRMRRITAYASRVSGGLLVAVGLYVGYYGYYEVRLFELGAGPDDRVVAAAGRLQGTLAGWVHQQGAWPWLAVLAVVTLAALLHARRRSPIAATINRHPDSGAS
jgi:cytochrome c biogenesis protein CcdA